MDNSKKPDSQYIQTMFDRLSGRYEVFCFLTSAGQDTRWRKRALEPLKPGMRVLDLGCGTGDMTLMAARKSPNHGTQIVGIDFSEKMIEQAEMSLRKDKKLASADIKFLRRRAEDLPMEREYYDLIVSGFVLRNIYENIEYILRGVHDSLKPGGKISFLDITEPSNPLQLALWRTYMNTVVGIYGKVLFGKNYPVYYLAESAQRFVKPPDFVKKLEMAGFKEIKVRKFMMGSIVLYQAVK